MVLGSEQIVFGVDDGTMSNLDIEIDNSDLVDYTVGDYSLLALHKSLIEIESISSNEWNVASYLQSYLQDVGLTVELHHVENNRSNVYAYVGQKRDTKLLVTSHIDTVPPYLPYDIRGSKIYGRGSCDAKGSVATQIISFLDLLKSGSVSEGDVALLYVVGEEVNGVGMDEVSRSLNATWESAIFGEPTELKLGVGHKGNYMFDLTATGVASHSGYPELGVSASEILIPVLNNLLNLELPRSDLLGPSTINIGQFQGGVAANVIPAHASASVFIRVASDITKIDKLVRQQIEDIDRLEFVVHPLIEPQYLDYDVPGFESIVLAYATDIPHLTIKLKKKYLYGPGSIHVAHSDHEYIENQDLIDAVDGYKRLVLHELKN
jgi:acetylornithine deacetylase